MQGLVSGQAKFVTHIGSKVLASDPSTRLLDGYFPKWTGENIHNLSFRRVSFLAKQSKR